MSALLQAVTRLIEEAERRTASLSRTDRAYLPSDMQRRERWHAAWTALAPLWTQIQEDGSNWTGLPTELDLPEELGCLDRLATACRETLDTLPCRELVAIRSTDGGVFAKVHLTGPVPAGHATRSRPIPGGWEIDGRGFRLQVAHREPPKTLESEDLVEVPDGFLGIGETTADEPAPPPPLAPEPEPPLPDQREAALLWIQAQLAKEEIEALVKTVPNWLRCAMLRGDSTPNNTAARLLELRFAAGPDVWPTTPATSVAIDRLVELHHAGVTFQVEGPEIPEIIEWARKRLEGQLETLETLTAELVRAAPSLPSARSDDDPTPPRGLAA